LRHLNRSAYRGGYGYEIDDPASNGRSGRSTIWLVEVVRQAVVEAGLRLDAERVVVLVGTGLREQASLEQWHTSGRPFAVEQWDYRKALQAALGMAVPVYTFVNACAASLCCLALARDLVAAGAADAVVVAGTDSIAQSMYGLLDRTNGQPPTVIQPFDRHRKGVLMGEGAAAIVLRASGREGIAPALARLRGVAQNCDAFNETAPDVRGVADAIRLAQRDAGLAPSAIDLVVAHGTGTQLNDDTEAAALAEVFGADAERTLLSGLKAMTGHTAGASGLIGLITAIEVMQSGSVPPTPGLIDPIDAAACFDIVRARRDGCQINSAQVNAFGFGGVNAVAIVERVDD
jgi:3-oxoacyl-[acyl-carrier-protein] synthase II